jgi:multicomponent Na+:H+ antiporter subunit E
LFSLWLLLTRAAPGDLALGAAWVSVRLLPPGARRWKIGALTTFAAHVVTQSIVAGFDVAKRALAPSLPLRPGYVSHPLRLPIGPARDAFSALTSLAPGTVPCGADARGALLVHALDVGLPVGEQIADDEARLARALGERTDA